MGHSLHLKIDSKIHPKKLWPHFEYNFLLLYDHKYNNTNHKFLTTPDNFRNIRPENIKQVTIILLESLIWDILPFFLQPHSI